MDIAFDSAAKRIQKDNDRRKKQALRDAALKRREEQKRRQIEQDYKRKAQIIREEKQRQLELEQQREIERASILYKRSLRYICRDEEGDRMIMPQSVLEELHGKHVGSLMTFKISRKLGEDIVVTHGGVLEFTAEEGTIELPRKIQQKLLLEDIPPLEYERGLVDNLVEVEYVSLPKGSFVRLEPQEPVKFHALPDPRAHLQAIMTSTCTTLTEGDTIAVKYGADSHLVNIVDLKPATAVSIIDTELEVDIYTPQYINEKENISAIPLVEGNAQVLQVPSNEWKYLKLIMAKDTLAEFLLSKTQMKLVIEVHNYRIDGSDVLAFLSLHEHPSLLTHNLKFPLTKGRKDFVISISDIPTFRENVPIFIALFGDHATANLKPCDVEISFEKCKSHESEENLENVELLDVERDGTPCSNCKKMIPSQNMVMHENFCMRNNVVCPYPDCGQVFLRKQQEFHCHCFNCGELFSSPDQVKSHELVFHTELPCSLCETFTSTLETLRDHQSSDCPKRVIKCRFCEDIVLSGGPPDDARDKFYWNLTKHESFCGNKTIVCDICKANVRLKEYQMHQQLHQTTSSRNTKPQNITTHTAQESQNVECPICSSSFSSIRKLNSHLDTTH